MVGNLEVRQEDVEKRADDETPLWMGWEGNKEALYERLENQSCPSKDGARDTHVGQFV